VQSCYIGCYADNSTSRDLKSRSTVSYSIMTVEYCINYCSSYNYKYAGLQNGAGCYCGDSYGKYGAAKISVCSSTCSGSTLEYMQTCGGWSINSIYNATCGSNIIFSLKIKKSKIYLILFVKEALINSQTTTTQPITTTKPPTTTTTPPKTGMFLR